MREVHGQYASAKVFTDQIDASALAQIQTLCDQPFSSGSQIRIMPDVHAGVGCTIGTTMTLTDRVIPNLVGVDIGCGMETVRLRETRLELSQLDKCIQSNIPSGFAVRARPHRRADEIDLTALQCADKVDTRRGLVALGTLGGGNHFIEVDRDEEGALYLVIHSGSRHLGLSVAQYYQKEAIRQCSNHSKEAHALIDAMKAEGRETEIGVALQRFHAEQREQAIPAPLCYLTGPLFEQYLSDMKLMQAYASLNRSIMIDEIVRGMKLHIEDRFSTIHNYIDTDHMILRKGAVSARAGERLLIPINMRDGSLIATGLGNDDWNQSAPHGAGRRYGRAETRQHFTLQAFKAEMKGIYSSSIRSDTLDECPMAYKRLEDIVDNIGETVTIDRIIRPIYNFKAGTEDA